MFQSFLGAIFDTLLYTLNDSLGRVMNIYKIEQEKEDSKLLSLLTILSFKILFTAKRWSSLPAEERAKKDMLATNEIRVSKGLLTMVLTTCTLYTIDISISSLLCGSLTYYCKC